MQSAFCVGVLQLLDSAEGQTVFTPEKLTDNVQFNFFGDLWYIPISVVREKLIKLSNFALKNYRLKSTTYVSR